jgi:hypothetical protein
MSYSEYPDAFLGLPRPPGPPAADKPEPPEDLWDRLAEAEAQVLQRREPQRPPGSFTTAEYAKRQGISVRWARERLGALRDAGKIELRGTGNAKYWVLIDGH